MLKPAQKGVCRISPSCLSTTLVPRTAAQLGHGHCKRRTTCLLITLLYACAETAEVLPLVTVFHSSASLPLEPLHFNSLVQGDRAGLLFCGCR